jgi:hypothetical protein
VLLIALGRDIALTTTDHAYYLREVAAVPFDQSGSIELAHKRVVNLEEAARMTYAALLLSAGDLSRVHQVPTRFLAAVGHGYASA